MNLLSEISSSSFRWKDIQKPKEQSIKLQIYCDPCSPKIYLSKPSISKEQPVMPFLRDVIYNINGRY